MSKEKKVQKYLGEKGLIVLITFLSVFLPMSIDLYLPALPGMARYFNAPESLINLTLVLFFIFYSTGMLIWGPLSDKYGRKPILLSGLTFFTLASLLCVWAGSVSQLIVYRIVQAAGGSAATATATAMVKDCYEGRKRESVLATVASMVMISPMVAPVLGGILLRFANWRITFFMLFLFGLLGIIAAFILEETVQEQYSGSVLQTFSRLGIVLRNPGFVSLLLIFSPLHIPMMAYVGGSSYIFVDRFGVSEQAYSLYFAVNAVFMVIGPLIYILVSRRYTRKPIIILSFALIIASSLLIITQGNLSAWLFTFSLIPATLAISVVRAPATNLMLEQQSGDTGSATSLISCFGLLMSSLGAFLISFDWQNQILILGIIQITVGIGCGVLWLLLSGKPFVKQLPDIRLK